MGILRALAKIFVADAIVNSDRREAKDIEDIPTSHRIASFIVFLGALGIFSMPMYLLFGFIPGTIFAIISGITFFFIGDGIANMIS